MEKNKNGLVWFLIIIIIILLGVILYLCKDKLMPNNVTTTNSSTTTTTTKSLEKPAELNNAVIEVFYDIATNQKYFLAEFVEEANGDIYNPTVHIIYDINYKKIAIIPELYNSHIWNKNGESIFGVGSEKNITAQLIGNKIYSLAKSSDNGYDFVQYESYIENGELKQQIVKTISAEDVNISGEK